MIVNDGKWWHRTSRKLMKASFLLAHARASNVVKVQTTQAPPNPCLDLPIVTSCAFNRDWPNRSEHDLCSWWANMRWQVFGKTQGPDAHQLLAWKFQMHISCEPWCLTDALFWGASRGISCPRCWMALDSMANFRPSSWSYTELSSGDFNGRSVGRKLATSNGS